MKCTEEVFNTIVNEFVTSQHNGFCPEMQGEWYALISEDGESIVRLYSIEPDEQLLPWHDGADIRPVEEFFDLDNNDFSWGSEEEEEAALAFAAFNCTLEVIEE